MISRDLYHLEQEVEKLEKELVRAPLEERPELKDRLRKVKADRDKLRGALEGSKEHPPYRRPR
jgi:hypothetical protein